MGCIIYHTVAKIKTLISCAVIAQLICAFVFAYVKSRISHDAAHTINIAVLGNPTNADAVVITRPWQLTGTLSDYKRMHY